MKKTLFKDFNCKLTLRNYAEQGVHGDLCFKYGVFFFFFIAVQSICPTMCIFTAFTSINNMVQI